MRKRKANCADCGRLTSVSASGVLHPHKHPGWRTQCRCQTPAEATTVDVPDDQPDLFDGQELNQ